MAGLYILLIIFPTIFLLTLIFIFQSALTEIKLQQFLYNCPYPQGNRFVSNVTIVDDIRVTYEETFTGNGTGSRFECTINDSLESINVSTFNYEQIDFSVVPSGWLTYASHSMTAFFQKTSAFFNMVWLYFNAPAEVSGLSFFTFINGFLVFLIGLGGFFAIRGIGN